MILLYLYFFPLLFLVFFLQLGEASSAEDKQVNDEDVKDNLDQTIAQQTNKGTSDDSTIIEQSDDAATKNSTTFFSIIDAPYSVNNNESLESQLERFLRNNPGEKEITSPGYPDPYVGNVSETWSITVEDGVGIDVTIHFLNVDPTKDFLFFRGGDENSTTEKGPILTGDISTPMKFRIVHSTQLFIKFVAQHENEDPNDEYKGFVLTYSSFGEIVTTTAAPVTKPTIPSDVMETVTKSIIVAKNEQNTDTWNKIRSYLAEAANLFISAYNLTLEECQPENVTFFDISPCPDNWPDSINCVQIQFAIPLDTIDESQDAISDDVETETIRYQLNKTNLELMWNKYAVTQTELKNLVYKLPEIDEILLLWIGVSILMIIAFLFVLWSIWKFDFFKDYKRMKSNNDDNQSTLETKSDYDISMFPSPHQIVPTLFPSNDVYNPPIEVREGHSHFLVNDFEDPAGSDLMNFETFRGPIANSSSNYNDRADNPQNVFLPNIPSPTKKEAILIRGFSREESVS